MNNQNYNPEKFEWPITETQSFFDKYLRGKTGRIVNLDDGQTLIIIDLGHVEIILRSHQLDHEHDFEKFFIVSELRSVKK